MFMVHRSPFPAISKRHGAAVVQFRFLKYNPLCPSLLKLLIRVLFLSWPETALVVPQGFFQQCSQWDDSPSAHESHTAPGIVSALAHSLKRQKYHTGHDSHMRHCLRVTVCASLHARHCLSVPFCASLSARHCLCVTVCASLSARHYLRVTDCASLSAHHYLRVTVCVSLSGRHCLRVTGCASLSAGLLF